MAYTVYLVTAPSGKQYVGITGLGVAARRGQHGSRARSGSSRPFHQALRKYGDAMKWTELETGLSFDEACASERYYIAALGSRAPSGYNCTEGGEGIPGYKFSVEARQEMSERRRGNKCALGCKHPYKSRKYPPRTAEHIANHIFATRHREIVDQYGVVYPSIAAASRILNLNQALVSASVHGRVSSVGGFIFRRLHSRS